MIFIHNIHPRMEMIANPIIWNLINPADVGVVPPEILADKIIVFCSLLSTFTGHIPKAFP